MCSRLHKILKINARDSKLGGLLLDMLLFLSKHVYAYYKSEDDVVSNLSWGWGLGLTKRRSGVTLCRLRVLYEMLEIKPGSIQGWLLLHPIFFGS